MNTQTSNPDEVKRVFELPEVLTPEEASLLLKISKRSLRRLVLAKVLTPIYLAKRSPRYRIGDIYALMTRGIEAPGR